MGMEKVAVIVAVIAFTAAFLMHLVRKKSLRSSIASPITIEED
jgi:hypothetical protein